MRREMKKLREDNEEMKRIEERKDGRRRRRGWRKG